MNARICDSLKILNYKKQVWLKDNIVIFTSKIPSIILKANRRYTLILAKQGVSSVSKAVQPIPIPNILLPPNLDARKPPTS